jgi:hypothetical protein
VQAAADRVFDADVDSFAALCRRGLIDFVASDHIDIVPLDLEAPPSEVRAVRVEPQGARPFVLSMADLVTFEERMGERFSQLCSDMGVGEGTPGS